MTDENGTPEEIGGDEYGADSIKVLDTSLQESILNLLNQLENLRYAPIDTGPPERRSLYEETRALLGKVKR